MSLKQVFDQACGSLRVDNKFATAVKRFANQFVHKNPEHTEFFGNGLLSSSARWLPADTRRYFTEILQADESDLQVAIHALPTVDKTHKVRSEAFGLSITYLVHRTLTSTLPEKLKKETAAYLIAILHYRYITSILIHFFPYDTNRSIAQRTYDSLNYKFDLKAARTWSNLVINRGYSVVANSSIHYQTFIKYNDDEKIQYIVSDIQTRIRVLIKGLTEAYYLIRDDRGSLSSVSTLVELDGEISIRDITRKTSTYRRYIQDTIPDMNSFIRLDLVNIIAEYTPSANPNFILTALRHLSVNYERGGLAKTYQEWINRQLDWGFQTLADRGVNLKNLPVVADTIKGAINTSRNPSPEIKWLRTTGDRLVRKALAKPTSFPVGGERTAVVMYVILRAMTMRHYQTQSLSNEQFAISADFSYIFDLVG